MPGLDGTGPRGQGAMTGGGRGRCAMALNNAGISPIERAFCGRGVGRGFRNCFKATGLAGWARAKRGMRAFGGFTGAMAKESNS